MRYYGDLVNALCYTIFLPVYLWLWLAQEPDNEGARNINIAFALTAVFSWYAVWKGSPLASSLAMLGMSSSIAGMNLYRWPHADEVVVIPQYLWSLLIVSGNWDLPLAYKLVNGSIALVNAVVVASLTPLLSLEDNIPTLLSAAAVYFGFHYYSTLRHREGGSLISPHGASLVLAGTFVYHVGHEITKMYSRAGYARDGGFAILKAAFFAVVGLAAAGAFRNEIDLNETLERLVEHRTREVLKQAKQLQIVERALQSSETAMAITDPNRRLVWSNTALEKLTHKSAKELQNVLIDELLDTVMAKPSWFSREGVTQNELKVNEEHIQVEISPIANQPQKWEQKDGSELGHKSNPKEQHRFLVVLKNITAQRARQRAEQAAVKEAMAAQAMQESMQTLSHELRTPLQGILGMASMLLDDPSLTKPTYEPLQVILTSARLLLTLINNLLDVRKCESAMMDEFNLSRMPLQKALAAATDFCKPFAGISGVDLSLRPNHKDLKGLCVLSNELRFQQVMINLISNAIKYSEGADVTIDVETSTVQEAEDTAAKSLAAGSPQDAFNGWSKTQRDATRVAIVHVRDCGAGIPPDQRDIVFGKFSQLKSSPTISIGGGKAHGQPSGTGLGLSLCLTFVKKMNGNIWANNNADKGSTFSFYMPMAPEEDSLSESSPSASTDEINNDKPVSPQSVTNSKAFGVNMFQVLVVDDTIINLKVLERMLVRIGVGKVKTASSGKDALQILCEESFNLVITDLQMPHMDGIELTSEILTRFEGRQVPVIVGLTAEVSESVDQKCNDAGMVQVLHKPITSTEMEAFFDSMLELPLLLKFE